MIGLYGIKIIAWLLFLPPPPTHQTFTSFQKIGRLFLCIFNIQSQRSLGSGGVKKYTYIQIKLEIL